MTTELTTKVDTANLPATRTGGKGLFKRVAKANDFLPRLQLFSKGKAVNKRLVQPGQYGVQVSDDEVTVYGDTIDMFVFAARAKALDRTNQKSVVVNFEDESTIFKSIEKRSFEKMPEGKINPCMFGIAFLTWISGYGFHEYFCRTKSSRAECGKLEPFMPISTVDVEEALADGEELFAQDAQPVTIGARCKEADDFSWHIMTIHRCTQPISDLPDQETVNEEITKFLSQKSTAVKLDENTGGAAEEGRVR